MNKKGLSWHNKDGKVIAYFLYRFETLVIDRSEVDSKMLNLIRKDIKDECQEILDIIDSKTHKSIKEIFDE